MRVLLTTRGSSGHVFPLVPVARALQRGGHEVLVAAQAQHRANVERTGLPYAAVGDPPPEEWMPLLGAFAERPLAEGHAAMVGEFFASIDTRAALPRLRELVATFRPDVIVRESWEFGSTIVAEEWGIPVARVGLGLAAVEEQTLALAGPALSRVRVQAGLAADPEGELLRGTPYLTAVPAVLDDPAIPLTEYAWRFAPPVAPPGPPSQLDAWWPRSDALLVYVTFGTVTAAPHLPYYPALYRGAIAALAEVDARVLVTVGEDRDLAELGPVPANVRIERWVSHDAVAAHAAVVVGHGGYGTTLGTLRHGVPLVLLPLFSLDQWANADAVVRAGAGIAVHDDPAVRGALELPDPELVGRLGDAVARVLADGAYAAAARRVAASDGDAHPADDVAPTLVAVAGCAATVC